MEHIYISNHVLNTVNVNKSDILTLFDLKLFKTFQNILAMKMKLRELQYV